MTQPPFREEEIFIRQSEQKRQSSNREEVEVAQGLLRMQENHKNLQMRCRLTRALSYLVAHLVKTSFPSMLDLEELEYMNDDFFTLLFQHMPCANARVFVFYGYGSGGVCSRCLFDDVSLSMQTLSLRHHNKSITNRRPWLPCGCSYCWLLDHHWTIQQITRTPAERANENNSCSQERCTVVLNCAGIASTSDCTP